MKPHFLRKNHFSAFKNSIKIWKNKTQGAENYMLN
jgi:hypothetical protein